MDKYPYFLYFLSFPLVSVKSVIFVLELNYMILLDSDINLILNLKFLKKKKKAHTQNKQTTFQYKHHNTCEIPAGITTLKNNAVRCLVLSGDRYNEM